MFNYDKKLIYQKNIIPIIKNAGKIINRNFRFNRNCYKKGFANYVTDLDEKVEQYLVMQIGKWFPSSTFVSEEGVTNKKSEDYWVIDPIDGTTNLIHGYPSVCISVAHVLHNEVVFGAVYCPNTQEMFYATKGFGAFLIKRNGSAKEINVNNQDRLEGSILGFGCPYDKSKIPYLMSVVGGLLQDCDDVKRHGPASLDICYVACGRLSAYIELDLEIWDHAAGALILQEAGGAICDFKGNPLEKRKTNVVATNSKITKEILDCIKEY